MIITRTLYDRLKRVSERYDVDESFNIPLIYLLGKNKKNIVCAAIKVRIRTDSGCEWMPAINSNDLARKYVNLVKKKFIPCGLARIADYLPDNGRMTDEVGWISKMRAGEYFVSVDRETFRSDGLCDKYDGYRSNEFSIEILEKNGKKTHHYDEE